MTVTGPVGSAVFHYHASYRLAAGADSRVPLAFVDLAGAAVDLSSYDSFVGAGRREKNEDLTTPPLFGVSVEYTAGGAADGSDGLLTLVVDGDELGQDTPRRGHYSMFGRTTAGARILLCSGRWECEGGTVDPTTPAVP